MHSEHVIKKADHHFANNQFLTNMSPTNTNAGKKAPARATRETTRTAPVLETAPPPAAAPPAPAAAPPAAPPSNNAASASPSPRKRRGQMKAAPKNKGRNKANIVDVLAHKVSLDGRIWVHSARYRSENDREREPYQKLIHDGIDVDPTFPATPSSRFACGHGLFHIGRLRESLEGNNMKLNDSGYGWRCVVQMFDSDMAAPDRSVMFEFCKRLASVSFVLLLVYFTESLSQLFPFILV